MLIDNGNNVKQTLHYDDRHELTIDNANDVQQVVQTM